jgi:hypothetical protein
MIAIEKPVNAKQAREVLGVGENFMTAVKKAMGVSSRYFYLSEVQKFLKSHPDFTIRSVSVKL